MLVEISIACSIIIICIGGGIYAFRRYAFYKEKKRATYIVHKYFPVETFDDSFEV